MKIIITRPKENLTELENFKNITFLPLFKYDETGFDLNLLNLYKAFVLTSQQASRFVIKHHFDKNAIYYCVGGKTASVLIEKGFNNVIYPANFNALSLFDEIKKQHPPSVPLAYLSGEIIKEPLHTLLTDQNYTCERYVVYQTKPLSPDLSLMRGDDGAIVFYSLETYTLFLRALKDQNHFDNITFKNWDIIFVLQKQSKGFVHSSIIDINWRKWSVLESTQDFIDYLKMKVIDHG
jgi:uroporphyrinogen-III synthase